MAKLYFYYSSMNAGKSTALLQSSYNYRERGMHTLVMAPELDIVVYAVNAADTAAASAGARRVFELAAQDDLHLAMIELPAALVTRYVPDMAHNSDTVTCLRSVLMKPEHRDWLDPIMSILESAASHSTGA